MCLAIERGFKDIAAMLEREGAKCTEEEIGQLGKSYTDFISSVVAPIVEEETGKQGHPSKQGKAEENAAKQGNGKGKGNKEAKETDKGYLQKKQMFNPLNRLQ